MPSHLIKIVFTTENQPNRVHVAYFINTLRAGLRHRTSIFVIDVIREVVLGSFWLMLPGLRPNR